MTVDELTEQLGAYPGDVQVQAMFPNGTDAYFTVLTELLTLAQGEQVVVVEIEATVPLRAV